LVARIVDDQAGVLAQLLAMVLPAFKAGAVFSPRLRFESFQDGKGLAVSGHPIAWFSLLKKECLAGPEGGRGLLVDV